MKVKEHIKEILSLNLRYLIGERAGSILYDKSQLDQYGEHWVKTLAHEGLLLRIAWLGFKIELLRLFVKE